MARGVSELDVALGSAPLYEPGDELDNTLQELGAAADITVRVYKIPQEGSNRRPALAARIPLSEFDALAVAQVYGHGTFLFQFVRGGKIVKAATQQIIAPIGSAAAALPPAPTSGDRHTEFLEKLVFTLLSRGEAGGSSGILDAVKLGSEMRKAPEAPPGTAILETVKATMELMRGGGRTEEDDARRGDPDGGSMSMFDRFAPRVFDLIERGLSREGRPAAAVAAPTAQVPTAAPAPAEDPLVSLLRRYSPAILAEAESGRSADAWGAFIAERVPAAYGPALDQLIEADPEERFAFLCAIEPRLAPHRAWIDAAFLGMTEEDGELDAANVDAPTAASKG